MSGQRQRELRSGLRVEWSDAMIDDIVEKRATDGQQATVSYFRL